MRKIQKWLIAAVVLVPFLKGNAQAGEGGSRVIPVAVPFLTIAADARSSGKGDTGVSTEFDAYSQQWNPAKYAFADRKTGVAVSYTPFLQSIVDDVALLNASFYNKIDDQSAFALSLRFFGLGDIELRQSINDPATIVTPNEFALDGSYSLKLSETFSMAVGGRFINSNLRLQDAVGDSQSASTFAVDVAGFYRSPEIAYNTFDGRWKAGFNISNLGGKIQYEEGGQENFIPANLGFGGGFDFIFDADNVFALNLEFNKLLVPTPRDFDGDGDIDAFDNDEFQSIGFLEGAIQSFGDAPDGFSEELQEVTIGFGAEYRYQDVFAIRGGYFNESEQKGSRRFATLGAGFKFRSAQIDLSYLFSTASVRNPLENILRFSLTFDFGQEYLND